MLGGFDAHVGGQQPRFELVEDFGIDLAARHQVREVVGQPGAGAIDLRAHAREKAGLGRVGGHGREEYQ